MIYSDSEISLLAENFSLLASATSFSFTSAASKIPVCADTSHSCHECEFYCNTPPNEGLCNVTLGKALGRGVCRNFVPQLHRSKSSDAKKASSCFSCGTPLEIAIHGRRKYCAHCGCYLPEILYDHRFTELVKPMDSVKPSRLGTVYTH